MSGTRVATMPLKVDVPSLLRMISCIRTKVDRSSSEVIVGFTDFKQAKLLHDTLFYPDSPDATPILVYFIDRLLLSIPLPNPTLHKRPITPQPQAPLFTAKTITTLPQLFEEFPSIAKQVVPKLASLLRDLNDKDPSD